MHKVYYIDLFFPRSIICICVYDLFQIYTDENHEIGSVLKNKHLFKAMTEFLTK